MRGNSDRLAERFRTLETRDRECQITCRKTFDTGDKLNECTQACFNKYSEAAEKIYR